MLVLRVEELVCMVTIQRKNPHPFRLLNFQTTTLEVGQARNQVVPNIARVHMLLGFTVNRYCNGVELVVGWSCFTYLTRALVLAGKDEVAFLIPTMPP